MENNDKIIKKRKLFYFFLSIIAIATIAIIAKTPATPHPVIDSTVSVLVLVIDVVLVIVSVFVTVTVAGAKAALTGGKFILNMLKLLGRILEINGSLWKHLNLLEKDL
jgi:hypothetical protein